MISIKLSPSNGIQDAGIVLQDICLTPYLTGILGIRCLECFSDLVSCPGIAGGNNTIIKSCRTMIDDAYRMSITSLK